MKKIRSAKLISVSVVLGSVAVACFDYSADPEATTASSGSSSTPTSSSPTSGSSTTTSDSTSGSASSGGGSGGSGGGSSASNGGAGSGATTTTGGPPNDAPMPCAILGDAGFPCVSAHSSVRVIAPGFDGPLYQLQRADGELLEIGTVEGYADAAAQDAFCKGSSCTIAILYDQSGVGNHLTPAPPGQAKPSWGDPVAADGLPVTINGRSVYGMLFRPGQGYRAACNECSYPPGGPAGTATGDEPQTMYMVSSQHDLINGCCFDYGNAEVTANNDGNGTMEAVYLGHGVIWGSGSGSGPWVMADLENGLYAGWENGQDQGISTNTSLLYDFVSAFVVGDTQDKNDGAGRFALYGGDATAGEVKTMYDGIRPEKPGYVPMQKQGSVILGIGGDNSDGDGGRFYEGVMSNGAAPKEVIDALQAAIVAANYGK